MSFNYCEICEIWRVTSDRDYCRHLMTEHCPIACKYPKPRNHAEILDGPTYLDVLRKLCRFGEMVGYEDPNCKAHQKPAPMETSPILKNPKSISKPFMHLMLNAASRLPGQVNYVTVDKKSLKKKIWDIKLSDALLLTDMFSILSNLLEDDVVVLKLRNSRNGLTPDYVPTELDWPGKSDVILKVNVLSVHESYTKPKKSKSIVPLELSETEFHRFDALLEDTIIRYVIISPILDEKSAVLAATGTSSAPSTSEVIVSNQTPDIGSKISLISKLDIRYEGILYTVDTNDSTIALAKVRSFGTENRSNDNPVAARDDVYECIIFKASDIKELIVCDTPEMASLEKAEGKTGRPDWKKERETNQETFGHNAVRSLNYRRGFGGRGRGGSRGYGGYINGYQNRGGYNNGGYRPNNRRFHANNGVYRPNSGRYSRRGYISRFYNNTTTSFGEKYDFKYIDDKEEQEQETNEETFGNNAVRSLNYRRGFGGPGRGGNRGYEGYNNGYQNRGGYNNGGYRPNNGGYRRGGYVPRDNQNNTAAVEQ
ncbi:hypothetical protein B9Z55_003668 [Caenorhabditis nigoni]|uniref:Uncharacterized protein n=1 Tax=Caenorhabditis nigoni TaxID=1611254 RepID=A0A2G5VRF6_9PELO|nr:hypothetical protein B9Z55_003668 [Caenorhabditis nigoni]